mmetsp:Transcript_19180/g.22097  ORF Transcript_19180/g.22097 Transcript_19180/m.22097 type:complete len:199 (-) Transcript_19180:415-1011(-)|eukprot:CAMPEP_0194446586 /NCGR_PEP_ID=MMETSP0176-20130528/128523_1 /TAXON_ID=216777 /ORGANISM="Proboscia alata, Strain PI-D3" /LENGTH=198 /DNA_ID=CAMNT_0039273319 /DNA_START=56 /DNA_END=652 /DNA_ORIENTATION=+
MSSIHQVPPSGPCNAHAFRLRPGDPLMSSLKDASEILFARMDPSVSSSAFILTAVGSLRDVTLRLANADANSVGGKGGGGNDIRRWTERFEIVSLVGTFARGGGVHIHASLSDAKGHTIGGHLIEGTIFTTCEVVMGTAKGVSFSRELDEDTGFKELKVGGTDDKSFGVYFRLRGLSLVGLGMLIGAGFQYGISKRRN